MRQQHLLSTGMATKIAVSANQIPGKMKIEGTEIRAFRASPFTFPGAEHATEVK